jgi:hypothetical protein
MVILVRCSDDTCSLAMESLLPGLIRDGLVSAFLRNGEWVEAKRSVVAGNRHDAMFPHIRTASPTPQVLSLP